MDLFAIEKQCSVPVHNHTRADHELEKVICGDEFCDAAMRLVRGATECAADGILDEGEFYRLVGIGNEIISRVRRNIEIARHFVMKGFIVGTEAGVVCLCYDLNHGPCENYCLEKCQKCPKGLSRFVPAEFHAAITADKTGFGL